MRPHCRDQQLPFVEPENFRGLMLLFGQEPTVALATEILKRVSYIPPVLLDGVMPYYTDNRESIAYGRPRLRRSCGPTLFMDQLSYK